MKLKKTHEFRLSLSPLALHGLCVDGFNALSYLLQGEVFEVVLKVGVDVVFELCRNWDFFV